MEASEPLILAGEVTLVPVSELDPVLQAQMDAAEGDYALTKERSRRTTRLLDRSGAELLEEFRAPSSIPAAIQRFSRKSGRSPGDVLNQSFELLSRLVRDGFLVQPIAGEASRLGPVETRGKWQVLESLRLLEDTEVYLVRSPAGDRGVLKRVSPVADAWIHHALRNEARVLGVLQGGSAPLLLEDGTEADTPYIVVGWLPGMNAQVAAAQVRRPWIPETRIPLAAMCASVLDCFAELHARDVLHGDVQPGNVLIDLETGRASLIDFGLAVEDGNTPATHMRGGVATFIDPESARAALAGESPPPPGRASEQYAVAALLYRLLSGHDYLEQRLELATWNEAVCNAPPREFSRFGLPPWPEVEAVLGRALAKQPCDRFASMADFRDAFARAASRPQRRRRSATTWKTPGLFAATVARLARPEEASRPLPRPTASVNFGASGIAAFLLRASELLQRPDLLSAADIWIERAKRETRSSPIDAFSNRDRGLDPATVGKTSLYHSAVGVHCVDARIALASDQERRLSEAIDALLVAASEPDDRADLVTGFAGQLIACAALLEALRAVGKTDECDRLRALGDRRMDELLRLPIDQSLPGASELFLGIAHGWAGAAYAAVRYSVAAQEPIPPQTLDALRALATAARRSNGAVWWPIGTMNDELLAGWCHGTAGHALLWAEVERSFPGNELGARELAVGAGEHIWQSPAPGTGHLCCGAAGQAYAFLALHRLTGNGIHIDRARSRLEHAVGFAGTSGMTTDSLYKGELGVALLEQDLAEPYLAAMPMFESERWP